MDNDTNDKIIDFLKKSNKSNSQGQTRIFKGFQYIKLNKDENGNLFKEDSLLEYAKKCFYIVTVVRNNGIAPAIYKYKVPYESLLNFLNEFRIRPAYGKIIDIERYVPEDLA